jgi:hypothetical protein
MLSIASALPITEPSGATARVGARADGRRGAVRRGRAAGRQGGKQLGLGKAGWEAAQLPACSARIGAQHPLRPQPLGTKPEATSHRPTCAIPQAEPAAATSLPKASALPQGRFSDFQAPPKAEDGTELDDEGWQGPGAHADRIPAHRPREASGLLAAQADAGAAIGSNSNSADGTDSMGSIYGGSAGSSTAGSFGGASIDGAGLGGEGATGPAADEPPRRDSGGEAGLPATPPYGGRARDGRLVSWQSVYEDLTAQTEGAAAIAAAAVAGPPADPKPQARCDGSASAGPWQAQQPRSACSHFGVSDTPTVCDAAAASPAAAAAAVTAAAAAAVALASVAAHGSKGLARMLHSAGGLPLRDVLAQLSELLARRASIASRRGSSSSSGGGASSGGARRVSITVLGLPALALRASCASKVGEDGGVRLSELWHGLDPRQDILQHLRTVNSVAAQLRAPAAAGGEAARRAEHQSGALAGVRAAVNDALLEATSPEPQPGNEEGGQGAAAEPASAMPASLKLSQVSLAASEGADSLRIPVSPYPLHAESQPHSLAMLPARRTPSPGPRGALPHSRPASTAARLSPPPLQRSLKGVGGATDAAAAARARAVAAARAAYAARGRAIGSAARGAGVPPPLPPLNGPAGHAGVTAAPGAAAVAPLRSPGRPTISSRLDLGALIAVMAPPAGAPPQATAAAGASSPPASPGDRRPPFAARLDLGTLLASSVPNTGGTPSQLLSDRGAAAQGAAAARQLRALRQGQGTQLLQLNSGNQQDVSTAGSQLHLPPPPQLPQCKRGAAGSPPPSDALLIPRGLTLPKRPPAAAAQGGGAMVEEEEEPPTPHGVAAIVSAFEAAYKQATSGILAWGDAAASQHQPKAASGIEGRPAAAAAPNPVGAAAALGRGGPGRRFEALLDALRRQAPGGRATNPRPEPSLGGSLAAQAGTPFVGGALTPQSRLSEDGRCVPYIMSRLLDCVRKIQGRTVQSTCQLVCAPPCLPACADGRRVAQRPPSNSPPTYAIATEWAACAAAAAAARLATGCSAPTQSAWHPSCMQCARSSKSAQAPAAAVAVLRPQSRCHTSNSDCCPRCRRRSGGWR